MGNNRNRNRSRKNPIEDAYIPPFAANILGLPLEDLKLREGTYELLKGAGFTTICEVVKKTENDFYRIMRFNKKNLIDLKYHLTGMKLFLKPQEEPKATAAPEEKPEQSQPPQPRQAQPIERALAHSERPAPASAPRELRRDNCDSRIITRDFRQDNRSDSRDSRDNRDSRARPIQPQRDDLRGNRNERPRLDDVSEKKTKELRERSRPPKNVPQIVQDIYVKLNKGGKWGFSDRQGRIVVQPVYDEVFSYKEDLCCVEVDERAGYISRTGEVIIEPQYECGFSFSEGYACVFKGGKCGYINAQNEVVVNFDFDAGTTFEEGTCRVKRDGKWGELYFIKNEDGSQKQEVRWII